MVEHERRTITLEASCEAETEAIARRFVQVAPPGSLVVLSGTLGAGKTRFVKAFAAANSVDQDEVASPTFVLCRHYVGEQTICHMDVYRLADVDEFESLGPEDLYATDGITFIEWGERVSEALPTERFEVSIEVVSECARRFQITALGKRLVQAIERLG